MFSSLGGGLCLQSHIESDTFARICQDYLVEPVRPHRKLWEFVYILRILELCDKLKPLTRGLGFGCGTERLIPALAKTGALVIASDLDGERAAKAGWVKTGQHSSNLHAWDHFLPTVCHPSVFYKNTQHLFIDMNNVASEFKKGEFDFVWSSCSFEHLGSLKHGSDFVLNTLDCLAPGGVAVHTTEYNVSSDTDTVDGGPTSIYRKRDIQALLKEAKKRKYEVSRMNWDTGNLANDNHVDVPPYNQDPHLKLRIQEYTCTSVGFFIRRPK